jgi:hypothetical protein
MNFKKMLYDSFEKLFMNFKNYFMILKDSFMSFNNFLGILKNIHYFPKKHDFKKIIHDFYNLILIF